MKNQNQFPFLLICTILLLSIPLSIAGQVDCSLRSGGAFSEPGGHWDRWCVDPPTDIVGTAYTCLGCQPGTAQHPPSFSKGGTKNCTAYGKTMTIIFSQPVADLEWEVFGATTVTDNRGHTVHLSPPVDSDGNPTGAAVARFPGGGITSIIVADPIVRNI